MLTRAATQFLDVDTAATAEDAAFSILPLPYEGAVSYGTGAAAAPEAVIRASAEVELYDCDCPVEAYRRGVYTVNPPPLPTASQAVRTVIADAVEELLQAGTMPLIIGGDHSVTIGCVDAVARRHETFSVVQFDAHADLRDSYNASPLSHACVMGRAREHTPHTLQIGIRSMCEEEAQMIAAESLQVFTRSRIRREGLKAVVDAFAELPEPVYVTIDVDVFDWAVVAATGTPEPDGMSWYEVLTLLEALCRCRQVCACDVVELAPRDGDLNSPFAVAKLIYRIMGLLTAAQMTDGR